MADNIQTELSSIFTHAQWETFHDGVESVFSRDLTAFMQTHGHVAIDALLGKYPSFDDEALGEAMRWIGHLDQPETLLRRIVLLERMLSHKSAKVRDGAGLGLASIDDPVHTNIPCLERAIKREDIPELRRDLQAVLDQLVETRAGQGDV